MVLFSPICCVLLTRHISEGLQTQMASTCGMYVVQSRSRVANFVMMASAFFKSFMRPSALDSASTHRIIFTQSLSVIPLLPSRCYLCRAVLALINNLVRRSARPCACNALFSASRASCCFWARITTLAFKIQVPQMFQIPPAENALFVSSSCFTC